MAILVINAGSSSFKLAIFENQKEALPVEEPIWKATLTWASTLQLTTIFQGKKHTQELTGSHEEAVRQALKSCWTGESAVIAGPNQISIVGHRIVHGGATYGQSIVLDETIMSDLKQFIPLAPLHEPANIEGIELAKELLPMTPQVGVFDTAYFHDMPADSKIFAIPFEWHERYGIRKFGFHGISHKFCAQKTAQIIGGQTSRPRVISCHLGAGSSVTASIDSHSQATTMSFTPLDGLVMGTRCGAIDPGLLLYLLKNVGLSVDELSKQLNFESGMKGISGRTGDMIQLTLLAQRGDERASQAVRMYTMSVARHVASLMAETDGADAIAFTGGIGENSPDVRAAVCSHLGFANVFLDKELNTSGPMDTIISSDKSSIKVVVIKTREELAIAQECARFILNHA